MKKKQKNPFLTNFEYFVFISIVGFFRILPLSAAYIIGNIISGLVFYIDFYHRKRTVQHLLHAGIISNKKEAHSLALKNFISLGKVFIEVVKFDQYITKENFHEHIQWGGSEKAKEVLKNSKNGIIFIGAHFGNWEMSGLGCSVLVRPITSVIRPFDNKRIGDYIIKKRNLFNQKICSKENAYRALIKALRKNEAVGILADQHASTSEGTQTEFFGHPARTHTSPAFLHLKTSAPLILGVARRIDNKMNFEFIVHGPFEKEPSEDTQKDINNLSQQFTSKLEEVIKQYPEQWLWCHRRWLDINRKQKK